MPKEKCLNYEQKETCDKTLVHAIGTPRDMYNAVLDDG